MNSVYTLALVALLALLTGARALKASPTALAASRVEEGYGVRAGGYQYETMWTDMRLDHFGFRNSSDTFRLRYLVARQYYRPGGPIFLYTGNEGPIDLFANNTGFMWDIAPEFGALLLFVEHRYYGDSKPCTDCFKDPKTSGKLNWLTSEQALADFVSVVRMLKEDPKQGLQDAAVVAFGGSYGGMLSSWIRIRYPWVVDGSIAASAPVLQFTGEAPATVYSAVLSRTWRAGSPACGPGISNSWSMMQSMPLPALSTAFSTCAPLQSHGDLFNWINGAIQYMAMADYPEPASFLGPMPAWPVKEACKLFKANDTDAGTLASLRGVANIFYNYTGQAGSCFQIAAAGPSTLQDAGGWNYQACTEMIMPIGQYGPPNDILWPAPWNLEAYVDGCSDTYGVASAPEWVPLSYGGHRLSAASNIVYSNGDLDPWSGGGVLQNVSDTVQAIIIEDGAHHLDLRAANKADPPSVITARNFHKAHITKWIQEHQSKLKAERKSQSRAEL